MLKWFYHQKFRELLLQGVLILALVWILFWVMGNLQENLAILGIDLGFSGFRDVAGFPISETLPVLFAGSLEILLLFSALLTAGFILRSRLRFKQEGKLRTLSMPWKVWLGFGWLAVPLCLWLCFALVTGEWSTLRTETFAADKSYALALATGLMNTVKVAVAGIFAASVLGLLVGLARTTASPALRFFGAAYVELLRNIPLLLQLVFWYAVVLSLFPLVQDGFEIGQSVFLNNRGLFLAKPIFAGDLGFFAFLSLAWFVLILGLARWGTQLKREHGHQPGKSFAAWTAILWPVFAVAGVFFASLVADIKVEFAYPEKVFGGRNLKGGMTLSPEFLALFMGLSLYTGAFIAEIVRSGISAVDTGQREAAQALGLKPRKVLSRVVLPQALRVMVPPLTSQYLNLAKNSSLAVAVGYPDLVSVGGTIMNQTGKSVEVILIWMSVYLTLSLLISFVMNVYNTQVRLIGR